MSQTTLGEHVDVDGPPEIYRYYVANFVTPKRYLPEEVERRHWHKLLEHYAPLCPHDLTCSVGCDRDTYRIDANLSREPLPAHLSHRDPVAILDERR